MTTLTDALAYWAAQPQPAPRVFTNHETDDHGFPLCGCAGCRERSKVVNAREVARMFAPIFTAAEKRAGMDLDKREARDNDEDYDVNPIQSGSGR